MLSEIKSFSAILGSTPLYLRRAISLKHPGASWDWSKMSYGTDQKYQDQNVKIASGVT